jgi:hypothetical protein
MVYNQRFTLIMARILIKARRPLGHLIYKKYIYIFKVFCAIRRLAIKIVFFEN